MKGSPTRRTPTAVLVLDKALLNMARARRRPPCTNLDIRHHWTSDDQAQRDRAAEWCSPCEVLNLCRAAADARGEYFHVWGGHDYTRNYRRDRADRADFSER